MERLLLKRHYQITLVNELIRIATFFMGSARLRIFTDRKCVCTSAGDSTDQNAHKKSLGIAVNMAQTKKGFRGNQLFPL